MTVLDEVAYTTSQSAISKTDVFTGRTGPLAGTADPGCSDASSGSAAKFSYPTVIGNDGSLVYINDASCGVRVVNPKTGAIRTLSVQSGQSFIAGEYLYTLDQWGTLYQYGLQTGVTHVVGRNIARESTLAAGDAPTTAGEQTDETVVWLVSGRTLTYVTMTDTAGTVSADPIGNFRTIT